MLSDCNYVHDGRTETMLMNIVIIGNKVDVITAFYNWSLVTYLNYLTTVDYEVNLAIGPPASGN